MEHGNSHIARKRDTLAAVAEIFLSFRHVPLRPMKSKIRLYSIVIDVWQNHVVSTVDGVHG